jgi:hypothetical protein
VLEEFGMIRGKPLDRAEHGAQMVLHRLLCALGIALRDAIGDLTMLAENHRQPIAVLQRQVPHAVELRLYRRDQMPDPWMVCDRQDVLVHCLVEGEELEVIGGADGALLGVDLAPQRSQLGGGGAFGSQTDGATFQRLANELAAGNVGEADRRDERADLRHDAQQTLLRQMLEHFTNRRAADAVLFGDPGFRQRLPRP